MTLDLDQSFTNLEYATFSESKFTLNMASMSSPRLLSLVGECQTFCLYFSKFILFNVAIKIFSVQFTYYCKNHHGSWQ